MKRINWNEIVERDGLFYHIDTNELVTGIVESFHENGRLKRRGNFKDGEQDGLWESYRENGQLSSTTNYKDGELDGLSEFFDEDGNLTKTETYKDGELVEENDNP